MNVGMTKWVASRLLWATPAPSFKAAFDSSDESNPENLIMTLFFPER